MAADPPQGRIGYVLDGLGDGRSPTGATKSVYCVSCRSWSPSDSQACVVCGRERPGFNKWLRTAQLNNQLYAQAEKAR